MLEALRIQNHSDLALQACGADFKQKVLRPYSMRMIGDSRLAALCTKAEVIKHPNKTAVTANDG